MLIYVCQQPSPSRQRRPAGRSLDDGGHEDGGEQLLAKMKEKNRSAQRRYRERIKVRLAHGTQRVHLPGLYTWLPHHVLASRLAQMLACRVLRSHGWRKAKKGCKS